MKKIFWFKVFPILVIVGIILLLNRFSWQGEDVSILSINDNKVEMTNMSSSRGMVNTYGISNIDLWIPNGMGWYPVSRFGLIVKNDPELARKVVFYNFGFWPKHVKLNEDWTKNKSLLLTLGPVGWLRFRLLSDDWLWRKETLKIDDLPEIMPRDLADNQVLKGDIKLNIVNASGKNGFGNMMADRLEWWGAMVTSVQTRDPVAKCSVYFDFKSKNSETIKNLASLLRCDKIDREGVVELVLGTETEEMVKYSQTYVRSL